MSAAEVARLRRLTRAELEAEQGRRAPSCACASWERAHGCACDAKDWTPGVALASGWGAHAHPGRAEGPRDDAEDVPSLGSVGSPPRAWRCTALRALGSSSAPSGRVLHVPPPDRGVSGRASACASTILESLPISETANRAQLPKDAGGKLASARKHYMCPPLPRGVEAGLSLRAEWNSRRVATHDHV